MASASPCPARSLERGHPLCPPLLLHLPLHPHRHLPPPGRLSCGWGDQAHPGQGAHGLNRKWTPICWLQVLLVLKLWTKIGGVSLISNTAYFLSLLSLGLILSRYKFGMKAWSPKANIFSESWVRKGSVDASPKKILLVNFWVQSVAPKKFSFLPISV